MEIRAEGLVELMLHIVVGGYHDNSRQFTFKYCTYHPLNRQ